MFLNPTSTFLVFLQVLYSNSLQDQDDHVGEPVPLGQGAPPVGLVGGPVPHTAVEQQVLDVRHEERNSLVQAPPRLMSHGLQAEQRLTGQRLLPLPQPLLESLVICPL